MKQRKGRRSKSPSGPVNFAFLWRFVTRHSSFAWCFSGLAGLTLLMFGSVLFGSSDIALSNQERGDISSQYAYWRQFGFEQLRTGHLPLWNPHIFSGAPFFGLQSGLLYPFNWLFLILPLGTAINWTIALHVFLAGAFTLLWAARRGLHPLACFLSGVLFMFCGPHFLHIYGGHLPHLCAMIWAPLIFLAIDGVFETTGRPSLREQNIDKPELRNATAPWIGLGIFAIVMLVLGGHPQYVFYTAVAAAIYVFLLFGSRLNELWRTRSSLETRSGSKPLASPTTHPVSHWRPLFSFPACVAACVLGGAALGAVQVLSGIHDVQQTWRGTGLSRELAASFSFPPENFLTLIAPWFLGTTTDYWGRWEIWEMNLFVSVTGLVLACIASISGERRTRRFSVVMAGLMLLLALGGYSPLFPILYKCVPGFGSLRGNSKFTLVAALFLSLLAGIGLDALLRGKRPGKGLLAGIVAAFLLCVSGALVLRAPGFILPSDSLWHRAVLGSLLGRLQKSATNADVAPDYLLQTSLHASHSLVFAAAILGAILFLIWLLPRLMPHARRLTLYSSCALVALAVAEMLIFARSTLDSFPLANLSDPNLTQLVTEHPGDYRVFNSFAPNAGMTLGTQDVWGYDPAIPGRYLKLLAAAGCADPTAGNQLLNPAASPGLFALFRLRYVFGRSHGQFAYRESPAFLSHALLLHRYRVLKDLPQVVSALKDPAFNPTQEVILEAAPSFSSSSASSSNETAHITGSSTDHLDIIADLQSPGILLITDNYVEGWHARALAGSIQQSYSVVPANYCLRGIPLAAGHHSLRLEYLPSAFVWGKWISLVSLGLFIGFLAVPGVGWLVRNARNVPAELTPLRPRHKRATT